MKTELEQIEEELRENHMQRIYDLTPGLTYFKLMKRGNELLKRKKELTPIEPEKEPAATLWSDYEVSELRRLYPNTEAKTISKLLNRTVDGVRDKVKRLGLSKQQ